jgi:LysM repeat protein
MLLKRLLQVCLILVLLLANLAFTGRAQAWSGCGGSYTVQRGDWLAKIAQNCGVTLSELYAANPWVNYQYYIYPGQVLVIPGAYDGGYDGGSTGGYCGPSYDVYGSYWVVCRGDTLGSIARYYGVRWRYLQQINDIWNANIIYPGQIIRL